MSRTWPMPIRQNDLIGWLITTGVAVLCGAGLLRATRVLEGQWVIAGVAGFSLIGLGVISGRFERFMFGLLFVMIPINPDVRFVFKELRLTGIDLILCCLYVAWVSRVLVERRVTTLRWPSSATWLVCLIGWSALSLVNVQFLRPGFVSLVEFMRVFLGFFYLVNNVKTREDLWLIARCLIAGLLIESLLAGAQHLTGSPLGLQAFGAQREFEEIEVGGDTLSRVSGTIGHPNDLGKYLEAVLPLALALGLSTARLRIRALAAGTFLLGSAVLVLTLSRGAWVSTALACVALVGWLSATSRRGQARLTQLVSAVLICAAILAWFAPLISARWFESNPRTAAARLPLMRVAWSIIASHPIVGVGLGNYKRVMQLYDPTPEAISVNYRKPVHNIYLLLAAQTGIMGLVFFLAFLWAAWRRGWQRIRAADDELVRLILLGIACGLLARVIHGLVDVSGLASMKIPFLWIYPALLVSGNQHVARRRAP